MKASHLPRPTQGHPAPGLLPQPLSWTSFRQPPSVSNIPPPQAADQILLILATHCFDLFNRTASCHPPSQLASMHLPPPPLQEPPPLLPQAKALVFTTTNAASTSDACATASSTASSPTCAAQAASVSNSVEIDDEGFITIANKTSRSCAAKSGNDLAPAPRPSPTPHPAPRPSVTVTRPPGNLFSAIPNSVVGDFCYHLQCRSSPGKRVSQSCHEKPRGQGRDLCPAPQGRGHLQPAQRHLIQTRCYLKTVTNEPADAHH